MWFILDKIVFQNTRPTLNIDLEKKEKEAMTVLQLYDVIITAECQFDNAVDQWWEKKKNCSMSH